MTADLASAFGVYLLFVVATFGIGYWLIHWGDK